MTESQNNSSEPCTEKDSQQTLNPESNSDSNTVAVKSHKETSDDSCPRRKRWLYLVPIILLLLIGGFDFLLTTSWGNSHDPALDLPDGAAVYIELSAPWNDPAISKALDSKSYRFLCTIDEGNNKWNSIRNTFASQLVDRQFNHPALKALKAVFGFDGTTYLGGRIGVAVYGINAGNPEFAASFSNFLPVRIGGLERAMGLLPKGFSWKLKRMGSASNPLQVYEISNKDLKLFVTATGDRLLATSSSDLMNKIAEAKFSSISKSKAHKEFISWKKDSKIRLLFFPEQFISKLAGAFTPGSGAASGWKYFNKLFNKIAFDGLDYRWIGLALDLSIEADGMVTVSGTVQAPLTKETSETATIEPPMITDPEAAKILPEDSYFAFCWEKDVPALWQDILKDQSPKQLAEIQADPTSKIFEEKFFPAMAKIHTLALVPQTLDSRISTEFPFPSLVLCFGLKEPATFSDVVYDTIDNFMEDLRAEYKERTEPIPFIDRRMNYEGVEINYFEIPNNPVKGAIVPTYIFLENYWIISTSIEGAKKCIDAAKKGKSLYNSNSFSATNLQNYTPASGWIFFEPQMLGMEFNTNATVWNEALVKIRPNDIPISELKYRPNEQAEYQNEIRIEQFRRKKLLDIYSSSTYNLAPSIAIYRETKNDLIWTFKLNIR